MKIGNLTVQPITVLLPDRREWIDRIFAGSIYFKEQGITDIYFTHGIHAEAFGIQASRPYQRDVPDTDWTLPPKTVGNYLSVYNIMNVANSHPEWSHIMYLEDDVRFVDGWLDRLNQAVLDVPTDFDFLFVSSCCTEGREQTHIRGEVWEVKYPQAPSCVIIANKCIPFILERCRDACKPFDVHLFDDVFPALKVYTILPRLGEQVDTYLPL